MYHRVNCPHFFSTTIINIVVFSPIIQFCLQVAARLISQAGSLTNLAKYPASTLQILGAEKALFRSVDMNIPNGSVISSFFQHEPMSALDTTISWPL